MYSAQDIEQRSNRQFLEMLLRHFLMREHILDAMHVKLKEIDMFSKYPDLNAIYHAVDEYRSVYKGIPSEEALKVELLETYNRYGIPFSMIDKIEAMITGWYRIPTFQDDVVQDNFYRIIQDHNANLIRNKIRITDDPDELLRVVSNGMSALSENPFTGIHEENPFNDLDFYLSTVKRYKTGVPFIDTILDGGLQLGESAGILAPSGGGKTTLGMQIAHGQVIRNEHVAYFSTEQKLKGDLSTRTCVVATTRPRSDFNKPYRELPFEVQEALCKVAPLWQRYFHFYDISDPITPIRSIQDVFRPVSKLIDEGKPPKIIILDWWGRLRDHMVIHADIANETALRRSSRDWLHTVKQEAERLGVSAILLHQLSGEQAEKSSNHKPSTHSAQEDKNFNNMFDWAFALGKLDGKNEAFFIADKARAAARTNVKVRLDGAHCRFTYASDTDFSQSGPKDIDPPDSHDKASRTIADDLKIEDPT